MPDAFELASTWDLAGHSPSVELSYNLLYEAIDFMRKHHYQQYVPTLGAESKDFHSRLTDWLNSVVDESDQRTMFELIPHLIFFGRDEFVKLHQAALNGPITRWVIDELGLRLDDPNLDSVVELELHQHTWYCPVTDSMQISDFHHANRLGGIDFRPEFRSLAHFGDQRRVLDFMANFCRNGSPCPLKRIVLLEDFVGYGTQVREALDFAAGLSPKIKVLLLPLIICPKGVENCKTYVGAHANSQYDAVMELPPELFIHDTSDFTARPFDKTIHDLAVATYTRVVGNAAASPRPYTPFGFQSTGARVVMYSNSPANTLPIVQHPSNTWAALFPRSARIR